MKIAIIFPKDSEALFNKNSKRTFGGASVQMYNIAKELDNYKEIKTYSLIPNYQKIEFGDNKKFNLVKAFDEEENIIFKTIKLYKILGKIKPDVIIQRGLTIFSCLLAKYCAIKGIKFIYMFASDMESEGKYQTSQKKCFLFNILLKNSYKLIVQNNAQKENLLNKYAKDSIILESGFLIPKKNMLKKKNILWVGRSDFLKKPNLFIELAKKFSEYYFIMICPQSKRISKQDYNRIKSNANKIKNLEFLEFVKFDEIDSYFNRAKLFINTSDYEGFPQTFIQATINSTPIISLNANPNNFLDKYHYGFCSNGDFELMKKQIKNILEDEKQWQKMSENGYHYVRESHDIKKNIKKLLKIIK